MLAVMEGIEDYGNYTYDYYVEGDTDGLYAEGDDLKVEHRQRETMHIISVVIYVVSFVLGIIGNGTVIWVTAFKSKRTVNSIWLLNLAMADLVFVLFLPSTLTTSCGTSTGTLAQPCVNSTHLCLP